jgi:hypothetical protein
MKKMFGKHWYNRQSEIVDSTIHCAVELGKSMKLQNSAPAYVIFPVYLGGGGRTIYPRVRVIK